MMIWDILNTLIDLLPNLIIGAGPFFAFKGMGTGSQSGKLLFKSIVGENISATDKSNGGLYQGGLIISSYKPSNTIYAVKESKANSIINSSCSCINSKSSSCAVCYSSIINSNKSVISQESSNTTIIGGDSNIICRSYQSTVLGGEKNYIYDYVSKKCEQSRINFIGGGVSNRILNTSELPPYTENEFLNISVGNSILIGCRNKTTSGFYSSILSGTCNLISLSASNIDSNSIKGNLIGSGYKNCIMSCSAKQNKLYCGSFQTIINGKANIVSNLSYSSVLNGYGNCIEGIFGPGKNPIANEICSSVIANGCCNVISGFANSAILNGYCNYIGGVTKAGVDLQNSVVINGCKNCVKASYATIVNGYNNVNLSSFSTIISGISNCITSSQLSTIVSVTGSCIQFSEESTIISNQSCTLRSNQSTIIGEYCNVICGKSPFAGLIGDNNNKSNVILANCCNIIKSTTTINGVNGLQISFIVGGSCNLIDSNSNAKAVGIIGGCKNRTLRSEGSIIIGGCYNFIGLTSSFYSGNSVQISSIIGGTCNRINFSICDTSISDPMAFRTSIIGGYKNSFTDHTSICNSVIVGGSSMSGYTTNNEGNPNIINNFTQTDIISVRGNVYVSDNSGNRCRGLSYLNLSPGTTINSICIIKGIVITMSYT